MLAFRLLIHALQQLVGNPWAVLRLGWPSLILVIALEVGILYHLDLGAMDIDGLGLVELAGRETISTGAVLAGQGASFVLYVLLAVSWHRHILMSEQPRLLRRGRAVQAAGYALASLLVALLVLAVLVPLLFMLDAIPAGNQLFISSPVGWFAVKIAAMTLYLRLMTALPGFALRRGEPLATAWRATRGQGLTYAFLAALAVIMEPLADPLPALFIAGAFHLGWIAAGVLSAMLSWLGVLIALALLTTLWGHFVEGRALR